MTRRRRRLAFPRGKDCPQYRKVWKLVDGAVAEAFRAHPDYLSDAVAAKTVRTSIVKRVTGAITGWATEVEQARSGERPAGEKTAGP